MNRGLDGRRLTREDLFRLAVEEGLLTEDEARSKRAAGPKFDVHKFTNDLVIRLWREGRLILDTSEREVSEQRPVGGGVR